MIRPGILNRPSGFGRENRCCCPINPRKAPEKVTSCLGSGAASVKKEPAGLRSSSTRPAGTNLNSSAAAPSIVKDARLVRLHITGRAVNGALFAVFSPRFSVLDRQKLESSWPRRSPGVNCTCYSWRRYLGLSLIPGGRHHFSTGLGTDSLAFCPALAEVPGGKVTSAAFLQSGLACGRAGVTSPDLYVFDDLTFPFRIPPCGPGNLAAGRILRDGLLSTPRHCRPLAEQEIGARGSGKKSPPKRLCLMLSPMRVAGKDGPATFFGLVQSARVLFRNGYRRNWNPLFEWGPRTPLLGPMWLLQPGLFFHPL